MAKKVKNLFKKMGDAYITGMKELYAPIIKCNVTPFV